MSHYWVHKAGRLANGYERGKGVVLHVIEARASHVEYSQARALCGAEPGRTSAGWLLPKGPPDKYRHCPRCMVKLPTSATAH